MKKKQFISAILTLFTSVILANAQQEIRKLLRVPDVAGYKTLKCDLHTHTVFSDGEVWPSLRVSEAWAEGLDVIAITDHSTVHSFRQDLRTDMARPYELGRERADSLGMILVPGIEVNKKGAPIHCNALFLSDPNALVGVDLEEALRRARAQDAFVLWNHPGWQRRSTEWLPLIDDLHRKGFIQGIEIYNSHTHYPEAFLWLAEKHLTAFANTDLHTLSSTEFEREQRPMTLVFAKTADVAGVRDALFARRTVAWAAGQLWGDAEYLRGLWEGAVKVENQELQLRPGIATIRLRNSSAIPFQCRISQAPAWLREITPGAPEDGTHVPAERTAGLRVLIGRNAPADLDGIALELEILNLHVAPGRSLTIQLPLRLRTALVKGND